MARQRRQTFVQRFERLERLVHVQRIRRKGHTESKTFIIGGEDAPVTIYTVIPKFRVGIDHDGETPEWKRLTGFAASLDTGTATLQWNLNGVPVGTTMSVSTTETVQDLDPQIDLVHGDQIAITLTATSTATGLSATAYMVTAAR